MSALVCKRLKGTIRHYAWGGNGYLPGVLGVPNPRNEPFAEYWLGAHPSSPAEILDGQQTSSLADVWATLGRGSFPYLFKVLDIAAPLSIQVHPDADQARRGFASENAKGMALDDPSRNYKDDSDKPELAVALSAFSMLYGLSPADEVIGRLATYPDLTWLSDCVAGRGTAGGFAALMHKSPTELRASNDHVRRIVGDGASRSGPELWMSRCLAEGGAEDPGILCFLLMNLVDLEPGEAVYQAPGVPHAYLSGQCVELMKNSDNVVRAGLTPKHIDRTALLELLDSTEMPGDAVTVSVRPRGRLSTYACPHPDLHLSLAATGNDPVEIDLAARAQPLVVWVERGESAVSMGDETLSLSPGQAAFLSPQAAARLALASDTRAWIAGEVD